jgi:hypothetical protein
MACTLDLWKIPEASYLWVLHVRFPGNHSPLLLRRVHFRASPQEGEVPEHQGLEPFLFASHNKHIELQMESEF